ncbi:MAG: lysylphosphatidylglycerol synthase transmembrane domain-containing protein [Candidatus Saccharimonadales bacterium]
MSNTRRSLRLSSRTWLSAAVTLVMIVVVWRQRTELAASLQLLFTASHDDFLAAIPFVCAGIMCAALAYKLLAFRDLPYRELLVVELAAGAINRLVPSGLGGLGLHGLYLHKHRHTAAQATVVATVNNLLGGIVHFCLLAVLLLLYPHSISQFHLGWSKYMGWVLLGLTLLAVAVSQFNIVRTVVGRFLRQVVRSLRQYQKRPLGIVLAAISLLVLTTLNVVVFWLATKTMGLQIAFATLLLIYTVGVALGAAMPTPGGLGGVEAGLLAGLIATGADSEAALAATMAFRFVTFWFPLLLGLPCLWYIRRRNLI